jgi:hypothetical protein
MNAISLIILVVLLVFVIGARRNLALAALIIGALFLTQGHALQIGGANLFPIRILIYACFLRVLLRGELDLSRMTSLDWRLAILYAFPALVVMSRPEESIPLQVAKLSDAAFGYLAFRGLIKTPDDLRWFLRALAVLLVPYVMLLAVESATQRNLFAIVGGNTTAWLRESTVRCFGSFRHPSLLGSLGATFFPVFVALALNRAQRVYGVMGAGLCLGVVFFSNSGGPLSALMVGVIGWLLWPMRARMRTFRFGLLSAFILLALVMKAPIYYLPSKLSVFTGGTGWHRSYLMDKAFENVGQWWFLGMPVQETVGWLPYSLAATGGSDITNQYLSFGLGGGFIAIVLFILFLQKCYSHLGRALWLVRKDENKHEEKLMWGLGVMLTVHVFNWFGITYFDQFEAIWLLQAASIASLSLFWMGKAVVREEASVPNPPFGQAQKVPV